MTRTIVVRGHVVGANTVQVDEPLPERLRDVEVVWHVADEDKGRPDQVAALLRSLPLGTRSKEDIDRQIDEDRGPWEL
jgi:hypothetical protein